MCTIGKVLEAIDGKRVIAWRMWRITKSGTLTSYYKQHSRWNSSARKLKYSPKINNLRGFWAYQKREKCWKRMNSSYQPNSGYLQIQLVMGQVELTGKIIKHTRGYRAQQCRIIGLVNAPTMAKKYNVKNLK